MDNLLQAAKQALEALWVCCEHNKCYHGETHNTVIQSSEAITALRQAIAQAEQLPEGFRDHAERIAELEQDQVKAAALSRARERLAVKAEQQEPVAKAWDEGYRQGIEDERTSEANIGIAGFNAKVEPNRCNPYGDYTAPPQREWVEPSDEQINELIYVCDGWELVRAVLKLAKELNT